MNGQDLFRGLDSLWTLSIWRPETGHETDVREKLCELLDLF